MVSRKHRKQPRKGTYRRSPGRHSRERGASQIAAEEHPNVHPQLNSEVVPENAPVNMSTESEVAMQEERPAIREALAEVQGIIRNLKRVLEEMEEVAELLEIAQIQRNHDVQEIEQLTRMLKEIQSKD